MLILLKQLYQIFTANERKTIAKLLSSMVIVAFLEVVGVALILPFMAMLITPDVIFHHSLLSNLYAMMGFQNPKNFLIFIGLVTLGIILGGNIFSVFTLSKMLQFSNMQESTLSVRLLKSYLGSSYMFFLTHHSSDLAKKILTEVSTIVDLILTPGVRLVSRGLIAITILIFLLILNPILSLVIFISIFGAYILIYMALRGKIGFYSQLLSTSNTDRHKIIKESLDAIKDVKFLDLEKTVAANYQSASFNHALSKAKGNIMAELPRYFPETLAFGGILAYIIVMLSLGKDVVHLIPVLTVYVYAGMRLMPAVQQAYMSFALVKLGSTTAAELVVDLVRAKEAMFSSYNRIASTKTLILNKELKLADVEFSYPGAEKPVFSHLNMTMLKGHIIGLAGRSGAGKTTLVDIILGLLQAAKGKIIVDEVTIDSDSMSAWRENIGYVPQHIYLLNRSVAENIALGVPLDNIDMARVKQAAREAAIDTFIENDLPDGYSTLLGGTGVRLSGGQQQRIGIARALYRNPKLLVLDEATSALDLMTEREIYAHLSQIAQDKIIVIITHRLSTLNIADIIYVFSAQEGIVEQGSYEELMDRNSLFNQLLTNEAQ